MVDEYRERWRKPLAATGQREGVFSGFAIEVGEVPDFADYDAFTAAVQASLQLDIQDLASGRSFVGTVDSQGNCSFENR